MNRVLRWMGKWVAVFVLILAFRAGVLAAPGNPVPQTEAQPVQWCGGGRSGYQNGSLIWAADSVLPGGREAGGISQQWILGDGSISFRIGNPGRVVWLGLCAAGERIQSATLAYALRGVGGSSPVFEVREMNRVRRLESGVDLRVDPFRVFCIRRQNGIVRYEVDGNEVYRSETPSQDPLQVCGLLSSPDASIDGALLESGPAFEDVPWESAAGFVSGYGPPGSAVMRTGAAPLGWQESRAIRALAGNGKFLFRFASERGETVAGLTCLDAGPEQFNQIGIRTRSDGRFEVFLNGVVQWISERVLRLTDIFCVEQSSNQMVVRCNDTVIFLMDSPGEAWVPFVATQIQGAGLTNTQISGLNLDAPVFWEPKPELVVGRGARGGSVSIKPGFSQGKTRMAQWWIGEGWIELRADPGNGQIQFTANCVYPSPSGNEKAGFRLRPGGWEISGADGNLVSSGESGLGDRFRWVRSGDCLSLYRNGQKIGQSSIAPGPLWLNIELEGAASWVWECLGYGFADPVTWRRAVGVLVEPGPGIGVFQGSRVFRNNGGGVGAFGAWGGLPLSGDGFFAFRLGDPRYRVLAGLSVVGGQSVPGRVEYGMQGQAGVLRLTVAGAPVVNQIPRDPGFGTVSFGRYTAADRFWVEHRGTELSFWKNGFCLHRVVLPEVLGLVPVCVLTDPRAALEDALIFVADSDSDGMADQWEQGQFGHLRRNGLGDYDADGLSDRIEFLSAGLPSDPFEDTDSDGLPDRWEHEVFQSTRWSAWEDPDRDGRNNALEWREQTDPLDRFDGVVPVLEIVSGNQQTVANGEFAAKPIAVRVVDRDSNPLAAAEVSFVVRTGGGLLSSTEETDSGGGSLSRVFRVFTDSNGFATVRFQMPENPVFLNSVIAGVRTRSGGFAGVEFNFYSGNLLDLEKLRLWLKADDGLQTEGQAVRAWEDLSGSANHALETAGLQSRPALVKLGGLSAVRFDGTNDQMEFRRPVEGSSFTIFAVVAPEATLSLPRVGVTYGLRGSGLNGQSYFLGAVPGSGESPWPKAPQAPSTFRFSRWQNRRFAEIVGVGRVCVPLAVVENALPVPLGQGPVVKRFDVSPMWFYNAEQNRYENNPSGGWSADRCAREWIGTQSSWSGWTRNIRQKGRNVFDQGLVDSLEEFYEVSAGQWAGLNDSTYPDVGVLTDVGCGLSLGKNGAAVFDLRDQFYPALGAFSCRAESGWRVIALRYENGQGKYFQNGVQIGESRGSIAGNVRAPDRLGGTGLASGFFKGSVFELLIFEGVPTNSEREALEDYLGENAGLRVPDRDRDSLPDYYEYRWFGDLDENAKGDPDGDGLTNGREFELGLNPANPDTDQDGIRDDLEVAARLSDPLNPDSDGDGFLDGWELARGQNPNSANNGLSDSNGNGVQDGWEFLLEYDPAKVDSDGDGIPDQNELLAGSDPYRFADTNGDGFRDELLPGSGIHPFRLDNDGDGLSNADELIRGTDPFLADSDGDGVPDGRDNFPLDPAKSSFGAGAGADRVAPTLKLIRPSHAMQVPLKSGN